MYPPGVESWMSGAMPPPGFYGVVYAQNYRADVLRGNDGEKLPVDFDLKANVVAPRFIWVTDYHVLGGKLALHTIIPLVDLRVSVGGEHDRKQGLGDITFGPGLGYHYGDNFHVVYGVDFYAPTGRYDRNDLANLGRNYWTAQAVVAMTYADPDGFNADAKIMYGANSKNTDTDYKSGQEFIVDYAVGWAVAAGWVAGVGGYYYQQTTDDYQHGDRVNDNKGKSFAIGPAIKYSSPHGWSLAAKWQREDYVKNRPEGDAFWLKLAFKY
ncbi:transporter [Pseudomonas sp. KCJK8751]|uniref:SphA family protein n=1 Tax=Pseudomonas sp. KCJK8751 TaxID=3344564 RepID=UPI003905982D